MTEIVDTVKENNGFLHFNTRKAHPAIRVMLVRCNNQRALRQPRSWPPVHWVNRSCLAPSVKQYISRVYTTDHMLTHFPYFILSGFIPFGASSPMELANSSTAFAGVNPAFVGSGVSN